MTAIEPLATSRLASGPASSAFARLKVWIINKSMATIVWNAVRAISPQELRPVAPLQAGPAYYPVNLLAVMTYCYALGELGSQEIEAMMAEDSEFLKLCRNEYPTWKMLRRFRRHNRSALEKCLSETFRVAWGFQSQPATPASFDGTRLNRSGLGNIQLMDEQTADNDWFASEARNRIEKAMWIDEMAMDDE